MSEIIKQWNRPIFKISSTGDRGVYFSVGAILLPRELSKPVHYNVLTIQCYRIKSRKLVDRETLSYQDKKRDGG